MLSGTSDQPINMKLGMSYYGDEQVLRSQLANFDTVTLDPQIVLIHEAWKASNYSAMEREVRKVKGAAGSVAATKLQIVAEKLEEGCKKNTPQAVDKLYGSFLMESRNLKIAIAALAEHTMNVESVDKFMREYSQRVGQPEFSNGRDSVGIGKRDSFRPENSSVDSKCECTLV